MVVLSSTSVKRAVAVAWYAPAVLSVLVAKYMAAWRDVVELFVSDVDLAESCSESCVGVGAGLFIQLSSWEQSRQSVRIIAVIQIELLFHPGHWFREHGPSPVSFFSPVLQCSIGWAWIYTRLRSPLRHRIRNNQPPNQNFHRSTSAQLNCIKHRYRFNYIVDCIQ